MVPKRIKITSSSHLTLIISRREHSSQSVMVTESMDITAQHFLKKFYQVRIIFFILLFLVNFVP